MTATVVQVESPPRLSRGLLASALLHGVLLLGSAYFLTFVTVPIDDPLRVTWIEPITPPPALMEEPGGSQGPAPEPPKPAAPKPEPKPVPKPLPKPVVKKILPKPNPMAKEVAPPAPPPPSNALSARLTENAYVDFSALTSGSLAVGPGSGRGRGGMLGDGVGSGVAPRRPIVYLSRSMYNPKRKDLEVYDKMFWHVIDHWELPHEYRDQENLITSINVRFDRDGSITKFKFVRKSGNPEFDDTVLRAIVSANPLPKPTEEFYQRFSDSGIDLIIEPKKIYFYSWPDPYARKKRRFGF